MVGWSSPWVIEDDDDRRTQRVLGAISERADRAQSPPATEMRDFETALADSPSHDAAFGQMRVATRIRGDPVATMAPHAIASVNGIDGQMSIGSIVAKSSMFPSSLRARLEASRHDSERNPRWPPTSTRPKKPSSTPRRHSSRCPPRLRRTTPRDPAARLLQPGRRGRRRGSRHRDELRSHPWRPNAARDVAGRGAEPTA